MLYNSWGTIQEHHWNPDYLLLTLAGICYAAAYIPAAIYWRYVMRTLGQQPGIFETFRAYYIGHLGKYVPGKAMVLIVRTGLLNHQRTKITAAGASVFVETMTMMAVGAFVAAVMSLFVLQKAEYGDWETLTQKAEPGSWLMLKAGPENWLMLTQKIEHGNWLMLLALGTMIGTVLPVLPVVFRFVAKRLKKFNIELEGLRHRTLAAGGLLNLPVWMMLGVSLWLTMLGLGMTSESVLNELPYCILAISCAVVFGFITMLPGGLGTRDIALLMILTPFFTAHPIEGIEAADMALVIVVVQRIISILSELAVSAVFGVMNVVQRS